MVDKTLPPLRSAMTATPSSAADRVPARSGASTETRTAAGRSAAGGSPRTVIRGESTPAGVKHGAIVDYLRFTFLPSGTISHALDQLQKYMRMWFPVSLNFVPSDKGIFGYESSYDVMCWSNGEIIRLAIIAMGGSSAGNTMLVDMSGLGCSLVEDWQAVYATLQDVDARITRADTALDLFEGYTVNQFDDMYFSGEFNCGGRIPSRRFTESGDSNRRDCYGKTLYLGKKANGKELCIYEKGRQLGNQDSEWIRIEIRFGNRDRVIPHEIVLEPTKFFAGGFLALESLVDSLPQKVITTKKEFAIEERGIVIKRLTHFCKTAYGKLFHQLAFEFDQDYHALVESIRVVGIPARLEKSTIAGGMNQEHGPS